MILDERLEFADAVALDTGAPATFLLGDQVPLSVARDLGTPVGDESGMLLVVQVVTTVTSGGAGTVQFSLDSDASAAIAVNGSQSQHAKTKVLALSELVAGAEFYLPLPPESPQEPYELFLGVTYTVGGAALTAGAVNAFLTRDSGRRGKTYASPSQYK